MNNNTWLNGSSYWNRTQAFSNGYTESTTGSLIELVYTYHNLGNGQVQITGYRNGVSMGSYTSGNAVNWNTNDP